MLEATQESEVPDHQWLRPYCPSSISTSAWATAMELGEGVFPPSFSPVPKKSFLVLGSHFLFHSCPGICCGCWGHQPLNTPRGFQRCSCISSPQLKVLGKRHVFPSLFPQRRCSQGAGGRLSVENAGQVKAAGAGATSSPVCWTSDFKVRKPSSPSKGQRRQKPGLANMEEGAA